MTMTVAPESQLADWLDHPIVREAFKRAGDHADTVQMLECLSTTLNELDDRFPGMSMRAILSAPSSLDKDEIRRQMRAAGVSPADIALALGASPGRPSIPSTTFMMVRDTPKVADWISQGWKLNTARRMMRLKRPLTQLEHRALVLLHEGRTIKSIAKELGTSVDVARTAKNKVDYQAWLRSNPA